MLSNLPSILTSASANATATATAKVDSLGLAARNRADSGSGFAALMQRQSDRQLSDLRLAEQRQTRAGRAEPGATAAPASGALRHDPASQPGSGSGSGSTSTPGANPRPADVPLAGRPAATAPASRKTPADADRTGDCAERSGGGADNNADNSADPSAGRSTAHDDAAGPNTDTASATPAKAGSRPAGASLGDSSESRNAASLTLNRKLQRTRNAAQDASQQAAAGAVAPRASAKAAAAAPAAVDSGSTAQERSRPEDTPLASITTPDTAQPWSTLLTGPGLARLAPSTVPGGAPAATTPLPSADAFEAADAGQRGDSLSALGRTGPQRKPATSGSADLSSPPGSGRSTAGWVAEQQRLRDAGTSRPTGPSSTLPPADAAVAAAGNLAASMPGPAVGTDATSKSALATSAGLAANALTQARPGSTPEAADLPAPALAGLTASPTTGRSELPGNAPGDRNTVAPIDTAHATAAALAGAPDLPGQLDEASAGPGARQTSTGSPATQPSTQPTAALPAPTAGAVRVADPGLPSHDPAPLPADTAGSGANRSANRIDTGSENAIRRAGDSAAVNSDSGASTLAPSGPGSAANLRPGATAADSLPGPSVALASDPAGPRATDSAANPASAPQTSTPAAGADPRRALTEAAAPDGTTPSRRSAGTERGSALGRESANTEAPAPTDLPATHRNAESARATGPLASAESAPSLPLHAAADRTGLDNSLGQHAADSAVASDAASAALTATTTAAAAATAAAPAAAPNRSDAPSPGAAPVEARITVPLDSAAFAPALGGQISLFARDGVQTARLQLNPAEMGPITVQIAVDGHAARIEFQADRAATREVIEASLPTLAGALQDAGLTLTGGGVFQQHPGRQAPPEPSPASAPARLPARDTGLDAVAAGLAASSRQRTSRGLVDLVA